MSLNGKFCKLQGTACQPCVCGDCGHNSQPTVLGEPGCTAMALLSQGTRNEQFGSYQLLTPPLSPDKEADMPRKTGSMGAVIDSAYRTSTRNTCHPIRTSPASRSHFTII